MPEGKLQRIVRRVGDVALIFGLSVLGYAGWQFSQLTMGQPLPAIGVDAGYVYLALPVTCSAMVLIQVGHFLDSFAIDVKGT